MNVSQRETHHPDRTDIILTVLYGIVILTGIVGNSLVILVVWRTRSMHTATNYLLVNLAASDIFVLLWCPNTYNYAVTLPDNKLGNYLCRFFLGDAVDTLCLGVTLFTLTVLAAERYQALVTPMRTKYTLNKQSVSYAIAATWILSLVISIPDFIFTHIDTTNGKCVSPFSPEANDVKATYVALAISLYIFLPLVVITFCYVQILRGMFITHTICAGPTNRNSEKRKLAVLLIAVTVVFYLLFLPFAISMLHVAFSKQSGRYNSSDEEVIVLKILTFLIVTNSSLNPVLYAFQSENYRRSFRTLFCRGNAVAPLENSATSAAYIDLQRIPRITVVNG